MKRPSGYSRGDTDGGAAANFPVNGVPNGLRRIAGPSAQPRPVDRRKSGWPARRGPLQMAGRRDLFRSAATSPNSTSAPFSCSPPAHATRTTGCCCTTSTRPGACFGQASYKLTDKLTITAGVRETNDTKNDPPAEDRQHRRRACRPTRAAPMSACRTRKPSWDVSALYQVDARRQPLCPRRARLPRADHPGPFGGVQRRLHHREFGDQHCPTKPASRASLWDNSAALER